MDSGPYDRGGRVASSEARGRHGSPTASSPARFKCPPGACASPVTPGHLGSLPSKLRFHFSVKSWAILMI